MSRPGTSRLALQGLTRLTESLPDFLGEARAEKPATFEIRLGKALRRQVDTCFGQENLRLERLTNHHTGQPLWRVVCMGSPPVTPHPLQGFEQPVETVHEGVAGDAGGAGDYMTPQAEKGVQEEMIPAPPSGQQVIGRLPAALEEHALSTAVCEQRKLPQQSPASPAFSATGQSAQEEGTVPASRCSVHGCGKAAIVHSDDADEEERTYGLWCAAHQDRSETMRLGMLLEPEYPRVEYAPGHTLCEGRQAWLRFHRQPQSSVEMVKRQVIALVEEQWREVA